MTRIPGDGKPSLHERGVLRTVQYHNETIAYDVIRQEQRKASVPNYNVVTRILWILKLVRILPNVLLA